MQRRQRMPVFGRPITDFLGQPALVKDILAKLRGSLCHSDMFLKPCSPRTREKVGLMRKIAGALMLWLECLPEPLIPQRLYWPLLQAVHEGDAEARRTKVQLLLRQVGSTALLVLFPLLELLHHLVVNGGVPHLLGARFAPLLLRAPGGAGAHAEPAQAAAAVTLLIRDYRSLFLAAAAPALAPPRADAAAVPRPAGDRSSGTRYGGGGGGGGIAAQMAANVSAQLALSHCGGRTQLGPFARGCAPTALSAWQRAAAPAAAAAISAQAGRASCSGLALEGGVSWPGAPGSPDTAGNTTPRHRTRAEADQIWAAAAEAEAAWAAAGSAGVAAAGIRCGAGSADASAGCDVHEGEIDRLLSGSLEAVLFELDDAAFRAAANPNPNPVAALRCVAGAPGSATGACAASCPSPGACLSPVAEPSWPASPESSAGSASSWGSAWFPPGTSSISPRTVVVGAGDAAEVCGKCARASCEARTAVPSACGAAEVGDQDAPMLCKPREGCTMAVLVPGRTAHGLVWPSSCAGGSGCSGPAMPEAAPGVCAGNSAPKRRLSDEARALLGERQTVALAQALEKSAACSDGPTRGGADHLRPLYVRYKRAMRGCKGAPA